MEKQSKSKVKSFDAINDGLDKSTREPSFQWELGKFVYTLMFYF